MRPVILACLFVIFGFIANAQFTILPQLGFESYRTSIEFNEFSSFLPAGVKTSPQAGIRLDYKFKQMHGPFLGIATSRSIVKFNFSDPVTGMNAYTASRGNTQIRLEGGYQFSTKPIYFKKSGSINTSPKLHCQRNMERGCCGTYRNKAAAVKSAGQGSWIRIQPSLGVAYIPFTPATEIYTRSKGTPQASYEFNAGNWKSALITGVDFEFGKNTKRTFVISINYLKSVGNLASENTTVSGNKPINTRLESDASSWNLRMGIPISFNKTRPAVKPQVIEKNYKERNRCGQYKLRCRRVI